MPISKKVEGVLDDFFTSGNEYDDNYGDDFDSADSEKDASTSTYKKVNSSKTSIQKSGREDTQTTIDSTPRSKRGHEKSYASSSGGYTKTDRVTYSEPLGSSRTHQSGTSYVRSDRGRTGAWYKNKKDHRKLIYNPPKPRNDTAVVKRVLSANRNKVNTLQNLILELQSEINHLRVENRDLKRSSRIQEKIIKKLDDDEAEIPVLIQKHNSEVRILREKLKRQKEGNDKFQDDIHKKDVEIQRLRDKMKKYEDIVKNKQLDERDRLQQKLRILEADLSDKETKITELERVVKLSEKVRSREVKEKNDKYKKAVDELKRLEVMQKDLQGRFKEKERELEVQNIYSRRITLKKKADKSPYPLGLNSRLEYDLNSQSMSTSPNVKFELLENGTKDKGKQEAALNQQTVTKEDSTVQEPGSVPVETMVSALRKQEEDLEKILDEERKRRQYEEDRRKLEEMEVRIRQKEEEIKRAEEEREMERRRAELEREQVFREQQRKEEQERLEAEKRRAEQERRRRAEELQAIKKLEEDGSRAEGEEDLIRKLAEQKERQRLLANDSAERAENEKLQAEKELEEKKQILLQRLRAIDEDENDNNTSPKQKKKPIFLESSRGDDDNKNPIKHPPLDFKRRGSKEYKFKRADENLHKGLPAHPDLIEGAKKKDDLLFGDYNPTVGSAGKKRTSRFQKDEKKSTKEDFLFFDTGSDKPAQNEKQKSGDFPFFDTKQAKKPGNEKTVDKSSSSLSDKQSLNRNRTKSLSDDDSLLFTIGGKKPDQAATKNNAGSPVNSKRDSGTKRDKGLFGGYEPTFGRPDSGNKKAVISPDSDPFQDDGPKFGRRGVQAKPSRPDQGFLSDVKNNVLSDSKDLFDDGKKAKGKATLAVETLSSFADDDIEEMVLT